MIVLSITNCPPNLRGDLSKWLSEINTGVYVGKVSARVRDALWERICDNIHEGQATMIFSAATAQGYDVRVHNTTWIPTDYEGLILMKRPLKQAPTPDAPELKPGFSHAAKYHRSKSPGKTSPSYVVLDLETTGLHADTDRILEIGALKIREEEITDILQCLIQCDQGIPQNIQQLTGITPDMVCMEGLEEKEAISQLLEFVGRCTVVGYNVKFDMSFLKQTCTRLNIPCTIQKTKDVLALARRRLEDPENYKLGTIASYLGCEAENRHRALDDCRLVYQIYCKLNEIGGT